MILAWDEAAHDRAAGRAEWGEVGGSAAVLYA